jgi:hypothetical protein
MQQMRGLDLWMSNPKATRILTATWPSVAQTPSLRQGQSVGRLCDALHEGYEQPVQMHALGQEVSAANKWEPTRMPTSQTPKIRE